VKPQLMVILLEKQSLCCLVGWVSLGESMCGFVADLPPSNQHTEEIRHKAWVSASLASKMQLRQRCNCLCTPYESLSANYSVNSARKRTAKGGWTAKPACGLTADTFCTRTTGNPRVERADCRICRLEEIRHGLGDCAQGRVTSLVKPAAPTTKVKGEL